MVEGRERGYFFVGIDEKYGQLEGLLPQVIVQGMFLEAPGFAAQAFYPVTVHCPGKMPGAGAKAHLYGIFVHRELYRHIDHPVRKNRKRFSVPKKRFNQFSAF